MVYEFFCLSKLNIYLKLLLEENIFCEKKYTRLYKLGI